MFNVRLVFAVAIVYLVTDRAQAKDADNYIQETIHNNDKTVENVQKYRPFETDSFREEVIYKLTEVNKRLEETKRNNGNRLENLKEALDLALSIWFIGWDCWRDEPCGYAGIYFRKAMLNLGAAIMKELPDGDQRKTAIQQHHPRAIKNGEVDFGVQTDFIFELLRDLYDKLERN